MLVAAAYNAGSGNVRRWIARNGDPRLPGTDVLRWIEDIPFTETRNYVQRVLENAVVYDLDGPHRGGAPAATALSRYLGEAADPGFGMTKGMADRPELHHPRRLRRLREEYEFLFAGERPQLLETIAWAAANGDRSENADYQYGRKRLREVDRRINFLSADEGGAR